MLFTAVLGEQRITAHFMNLLHIWSYIHNHSSNLIRHKVNPNFPCLLKDDGFQILILFSLMHCYIRPKDGISIKSLTATTEFIFRIFHVNWYYTHWKKKNHFAFFSFTKDIYKFPRSNSMSFYPLILPSTIPHTLRFHFISVLVYSSILAFTGFPSF